MEEQILNDITPELMKELNIKSIEDYRQMIKDDKPKKNDNKSKIIQTQAKVSNTKMKEQIRKKQSVINRKMKNENRAKILESLSKHKNAESNLLENLESMKNLGKKRKKKDSLEDNCRKNSLNKDIIDRITEKSLEEDEDISILSSQGDDEIEILKQNRKSSQIEFEENETKISDRDHQICLLDEETKRKIVEGIKELREKQLNAEYAQEEEFTTELTLEIPSKQDIIQVARSDEIHNQRINLPVIKYEHEIMDKINHSLVTVICGETGSGKSTQIPQFLYEAGYTKSIGKIAVTEPRKVAAISLCNRVSSELGTKLGAEVGYQVRYDSKHFNANTHIKVKIIF